MEVYLEGFAINYYTECTVIANLTYPGMLSVINHNYSSGVLVVVEQPTHTISF